LPREISCARPLARTPPPVGAAGDVGDGPGAVVTGAAVVGGAATEDAGPTDDDGPDALVVVPCRGRVACVGLQATAAAASSSGNHLGARRGQALACLRRCRRGTPESVGSLPMATAEPAA
jgi:hypothetical protein